MIHQKHFVIDLIASISGPTFRSIWRHKKRGRLGKESVFFIGLDELIRAKKAAGRHQDLADLELLEAAKKKTRPRPRAKS